MRGAGVPDIPRGLPRTSRGKTRAPHRPLRPAAGPQPPRSSRCAHVLPAVGCRASPRSLRPERPAPLIAPPARCPPSTGLPRAWWWYWPAAALKRGERQRRWKTAKRFLVASFAHVIRVDLTPSPAHRCAWQMSANRIRYSPRQRAQREFELRRFPASRSRDAGRPVPPPRSSGSGLAAGTGQSAGAAPHSPLDALPPQRAA